LKQTKQNIDSVERLGMRLVGTNEGTNVRQTVDQLNNGFTALDTQV